MPSVRNTILALIACLGPILCAQSKPNIIYVLADDLGYGDLGCYGQKVIQTPHLDQMAEEGMRFTRHYAGSSVCAPSRSALFEGKHSGHTYVRGNGKIQMRRDPHEPIFPSALKEAGYATALIGKSALGCNTQDAQLLLDKGLDYFFGFTSHVDAHWYYPEYLWRNTEKVVYPENRRHSGDHYSPDQVMGEALDYVEAHQDGPFFLHIAFQIPHASLRAKEEWKAKYRPILNEVPLPERLGEEPHHYSYEQEPRTTYAAMISYMDHNMGLLLGKLRELGIAEQTLVIFSSDNGAASEGGHSRFAFKSSGGLRGGKRDLYEGGVRVPMIAWWPGQIPAGRVSEHVSAFWDVSPTLREVAGAAPQCDTDGISFLPTLLCEEGQAEHAYLYWEFYEQGGKQAVLQGPWKLILFDTKKQLKPRAELYHLESDPAENRNLAESRPTILKELIGRIGEAHTLAANPKFRIAGE